MPPSAWDHGVSKWPQCESLTEPNLILLAGPNGAGKSTAAPDLLRELYTPIAKSWHFFDHTQKPRRLLATGGAAHGEYVFDHDLWDRLNKEYGDVGKR